MSDLAGSAPHAAGRWRSPRALARVDFLVVGGGAAGLWLLDVLVAGGYSALLVEQDALGSGQTMAAQGIVHGGIKYALGGHLSAASEAMAGMPARWRAHLAGGKPPDLLGTRIVAERFLMFAADRAGGLAGFVAQQALHGRASVLEPSPPPFAGRFRGTVFALPDFVVDVGSLIGVLARAHAARILCAAWPIGRGIVGGAAGVLIEHGGEQFPIDCQRIVLAAGAGNPGVARLLGVDLPMQRRPLHQVYAAGQLPLVNAHCLTGVRGVEPRLTITSHDSGTDGRRVWALGGALATAGVDRDERAQVALAGRELRACCGWLDLPGDLAFATRRIDRAEPPAVGGRQPGDAFLQRIGDVYACWPSKLTLVPALADRLLAELAAEHLAPRADAACQLAPALPPTMAPPPWAGLPWN